MKKIIQTIKDIFAIADLRTRIFNTILFLLVFRLGSYVVLPGVNPGMIDSSNTQSGFLGIVNTFSGGAFSNVSVFALGIMPYITASIVIQLLTFAVPQVQKLQKEGESGRKKLNNWTRLLTIIVCTFQSIGYLAAYVKPEMLFSGMDSLFFYFSRIIILIGGTMFCLWLGEKITDKGIGNGTSMLIMIGIISRFPHAITIEAYTKGFKGAFPFVIELVALFVVVMFVVMITQAVRKVPVQYAKQIVGGKVYGGQRQYLPLKVIAAGVMPIIFAQSVMVLPPMIASFVGQESDFAVQMATAFADFTTWQYNLLLVFLIIVFTFFYTALSVNPKNISDDMKRNGGFIAGVKPGDETSNFIDDILSKITLPGAIFLCAIAILPSIASMVGITREFAYFYGGTSLLIIVGVVLDTIQQVESYLLMKEYDGMMKSGKVLSSTVSESVA
ncbi:MAG: preprotein translocase subunit SecY [Cytophagales bacterium]|nr:MAG: preprotein translocase subunit SecY [Cytophagales bacterium]